MIKRFIKIMFSEVSIIPWMILVSLIPMIFISVYSFYLAKKFFQDDIEGNLMISLLKKIEIINNYIDERKLDLIQIGQLPDLIKVIKEAEVNGEVGVLDQNKLKGITNYLLEYENNIKAQNVYILNTNARFIYSLNNEKMIGKTLAPVSSESADLYEAYMGAKIIRIPYVVAYYDVNKVPQTGIYLANPIYDDGKTIAVLLIQLDAEDIQDVINSYLSYGNILEETYLGMMKNNKPLIFMHSRGDMLEGNETLINKKLMSYMVDAVKGNRGKPTTVQLGNASDLIVYDYVSDLNMGMLLQYNKNEIYRIVSWLRFRMILTIAISLILVFIAVFFIARKLWQANVKSEELLRNILPEFVIDESKEKKQYLPRKMTAVSILFCDIVEFTPYASKNTPETVVKMLDELFSTFDQLASEFGLEKIKTIGDAYMAVAGLITPHADHANRALDMGLAMIKAVKHYNLDHGTHFALRVGIDSGEVTTGIIGRKKFSYDLWGNAVNRASRMETSGVPECVQISPDTFALLSNKERYSITQRSDVMIKGLGVMTTYVVQ